MNWKPYADALGQYAFAAVIASVFLSLEFLEHFKCKRILKIIDDFLMRHTEGQAP